MSSPIRDKAEVSLELADKVYVGIFEQPSRYEVDFDRAGVSLTLQRAGVADVTKTVRIHLHYALLTDILTDLAGATAGVPSDDCHDELRAAAALLSRALVRENPPDDANLTADQEVRLLHLLE